MSMVKINNFPYPLIHIGTSFNSYVLDAVDELFAYVLQAPKTGTIKKIGWRVNAVSSPSGFKCYVSIETVADAAGAPVATTRAGATLFSAGAESAELSISAAADRYDAINGATGVSVTKGDKIAVVIRCSAVTSGSVSVALEQYLGLIAPLRGAYITAYSYGYNGTGAAYGVPILTLEYDGEIVCTPFTVPLTSGATYNSWTSTTNPDRRGLKFKFPFGCKASGAIFYSDYDVDMDLILYGSDEYSVVTGFPITLDKDKRAGTSGGVVYVEFPTEPEFTADTFYRLVLLPKSSSANVCNLTMSPTGDGGLSGMAAYAEGSNCIYTTFNGAPSSGSHAWTDTNTARPFMCLMVSEIDIPSGGGGGLPILGGSVVR